MLAAEASAPEAEVGHPCPRIAPPVPAVTRLAEFEAEAECCGIDLFPWQRTAARYDWAVGPSGRWLYGEVADIVARQNGKTERLVPHIVARLRAGRRIMHTAQNRELPREVFGRVVDHMVSAHSGELARKPRFANGQEEVRLLGGGHYRIVAPTRGGARGPSNDDVIVDELREMDAWDFIAAAKPTLTASPDPQILYLSNMGDESSAVLNALAARAGSDPRLAYLEWSAAPSRAADDREGWLESNPAAGHMAHLMEYLEDEYRANLLGGTMGIFETEHLCRQVRTRLPAFVAQAAWDGAGPSGLGPARSAVLGLALEPDGSRASAAAAWRSGDSTDVRLVADVTGSPIDLDALGADLARALPALRIARVVFDPYSEHLSRHFRRPEPMSGRDFVNASGTFARLLESGRIRWADAEAVGADLPYATRKSVGPGAFMASAAVAGRPVTALLAAVRAVGALYGPRPIAPRIM